MADEPLDEMIARAKSELRSKQIFRDKSGETLREIGILLLVFFGPAERYFKGALGDWTGTGLASVLSVALILIGLYFEESAEDP